MKDSDSGHTTTIEETLRLPTQLLLPTAFFSLYWSWWMLFHETAPQYLLPQQLFLSVDAWIANCQICSIGICFGLFIAFLMRNVSLKDAAFRLILSIQFILSILFYCALFNEPLPLTVFAITVQFFVQATSTFLLVRLCSRLVGQYEHLSIRAYIPMLSIIFISSAFIAHLIFYFLESAAPPFIRATLHILLFVLASIMILLWLKRNKRSIRSKYSTGTQNNEMANLSVDTSSAKGCRPEKRFPLLVHLVIYGIMIGVLHVIPARVVSSIDVRILSYFIGAALAAVLFVIIFKKRHLALQAVWQRICDLVFPLVILSLMLMPLMTGDASFPALVLSETGTNLYILLVILGCLIVARESEKPVSYILSGALFAISAGRVIGSIGSIVFRIFAPMTSVSFSVLAAAMFILLMTGTYWVGVAQNLKTLWGFVADLPPKAFHDQQIIKYCEELAVRYRLTDREYNILVLLAQDKRPQEMSEMLVISITTVRTHIQRIYRKLDIHSHQELMDMISKLD